MKVPRFVTSIWPAVAVIATAAAVQAQDDAWKGASVKSNNWANGGNWHDGTPPLSLQSWRMRFDELTGPHNVANYTYLQSDPDHSFPNVTIVGGNPNSMTFLKSGDNNINVTTKLTLDGTSGFPGSIDIQANGFSVGAGLPTEVKGISQVNVAADKSAGLGEITITSAAAASELKKLGAGTLSASKITIDGFDLNPVALTWDAGTLTGGTQLILDGTTWGGMPTVNANASLSVASTTATGGYPQINIASGATLGAGPTAVIPDPATQYLAGVIIGRPEIQTSGEYNATTITITGQNDEAAEMHVLNGMLRTTGLVTLIKNGTSSSMLRTEHPSVTDIHSMEQRVGTHFSVAGNVTIRGEYKVTGQSYPDIGINGQSRLEVGSLVIQGNVFQPLIMNGGDLVTR